MLISEEKTRCYASIFKRLRYFDGLMLKKEDFEAEQHYVREKARLHNRLHGYGIVWGLKLTSKCVDVNGESVFKLCIEPGFALDCAGNEILVCEPHRVDVEAKLRDLQRACVTFNPLPPLCIGIEYCECKSNPEPQYTALHCDGDPQPSQFSRVREGYQVRVFTEDELPESCKAQTTHYTSPKPHDKTDCLGLSKCCCEHCPIILGCIKDYLPRDDKKQYTFPGNIETHPFPPSRIDPTYYPPTVHNAWEQHKQSVLNTACQAFDWVDLSSLVGQPLERAKAAMGEMHLTSGQEYSLSAIAEAGERARLIDRIERSRCYVPRNTTVDLIVDQKQAVVLVIPEDTSA